MLVIRWVAQKFSPNILKPSLGYALSIIERMHMRALPTLPLNIAAVLVFVVAGLSQPQANAADNSVARAIRDLMKSVGPIDIRVNRVVKINTIQFACSVYNERMAEAHEDAYRRAVADLGLRTVEDQAYVAQMRQNNWLAFDGAHKQFCAEAVRDWGEDDPSAWERHSIRLTPQE